MQKRLKYSTCFCGSELSVQAGGSLPLLSVWRDGCTNARQPLNVTFVLFVLRGQVVNALEANPTARRTQLHHKFDQVVALMEDNIYECSSEA